MSGIRPGSDRGECSIVTRTFRQLGIAALGLCLLAGCAGGGKARVSGKVTHNGKNLVFGTVEMKGPDGISIPGYIMPDGTYSVDGVASGTVQIAVISNDPGRTAYRPGMGRGTKEQGDPPPAAAAKPAMDLGKWFAIPAKYADMATSGLSATIKSGEQTHNIDLP